MGSKCYDDEKLPCCHSQEHILLFLTRTPWRFSINELAKVTNFHRNSLRPVLKSLVESNKIQTFGEKNHSLYYYNGVIDHYRRIAKSLHSEGDDIKESQRIAIKFGYQLVKNTLKEALTDGIFKFHHHSVHEMLLHVKWAFPFSDLLYTKDGEYRPGTVFTIGDHNTTFSSIDPNDFSVRIHPCLCRGEAESQIACALTMGALKGAIEGTCDIKTEVTWTSYGIHEEFGSYCEYQVKALDPLPINFHHVSDNVKHVEN
ncbi:MAG: hypothetical protein OEZ01_10460 [Candidatus Heimdallarchaeota archaeon]|nr:hypothetical protein [Candidatus Heimdallarchaeota archaeon]MDH5646422.1 hypothetical protein [Candidatus Heimdallarchaeota archaeon]